MKNKRIKEKLRPRGRVELWATEKSKPVLELFDPIPTMPGFPKVHLRHNLDFSKCSVKDHFVKENIVVNIGKDKVITSLSTGFLNVIARMSIGDRGTIPSDPTVPKVPEATATALFNEVYRDDIDATILDVGTPTIHEVTFIKTFSAVVIPITSFSNQASPVVNEVGLITADLLSGTPLPRAPVAAPNPPEADEELFALRTFKSVPFEAANEISVTIRYTIFIE